MKYLLFSRLIVWKRNKMFPFITDTHKSRPRSYLEKMSLSFKRVGYISLILDRVNSPFFTGPTYSQSPTIKMSSLIDQIGLLLLLQQIFGVILYLDKGNSSNDNVPLYWILQSQGVRCFRCRLCRSLILVPQIGIGGYL